MACWLLQSGRSARRSQTWASSQPTGFDSPRSRRSRRTVSPSPGVSYRRKRAVSVSISVWTSLVSVTCASSRTSPTSRRTSVRARVVLPTLVCETSPSVIRPGTLTAPGPRPGRGARREAAAAPPCDSRPRVAPPGGAAPPAFRRGAGDTRTRPRRDQPVPQSGGALEQLPDQLAVHLALRRLGEAHDEGEPSLTLRPRRRRPTVVGQRSLEPLGGLGPVGDRRADVQRDRDALEPLQALAQRIGGDRVELAAVGNRVHVRRVAAVLGQEAPVVRLVEIENHAACPCRARGRCRWPPAPAAARSPRGARSSRGGG